VDAYWRQQHVCASLRAPGGYEVFVPFRKFVSVDSLDWSGLTFHCVPFLSPPIRKPSQTQTLPAMPLKKNYGQRENILTE
jgi:hypothetical protein